jgi:hypothetical protein
MTQPQRVVDRPGDVAAADQPCRDAGPAEGRPAASGGVPAGSAYAATLLIQREFMHHLGFVAIGLPGTEPSVDLR